MSSDAEVSGRGSAAAAAGGVSPPARLQPGYTAQKRRGRIGGAGDSQSPGLLVAEAPAKVKAKGKAKAQARGKGSALEESGVAPRLVDVKGAGAFLAVSPWTVRGLTWAGKLACVKIGRLVRYDVEDLARFIATNKHQGEP